jgi:cytochrome c
MWKMFMYPDRLMVLALALFAFPAMAGEDQGKGGQAHGDLGRSASPAEIALLDIDVRGDGAGLPKGQGSVLDGEEIYDQKCAACHGDFGEGDGRQPVLSGGEGTLRDERPLKTVGSFWPFAGTLYDYIYRTMPFGDAQSMSADETYAVVAYILFLNGLVEEDAVLDAESLGKIRLPNRDGFFIAPPERHINLPAPCMKNCKKDVVITSRAGVLDVTPGN